MKALFRQLPSILVLISFVAAGSQASGNSDPSDMLVETREEMEAYVELLRKDFEVVKIDLINDAMHLNPEESAVFWPIYQIYESERKELSNERFGIIYDFSQTIDEMTDTIADELAKRSLALEREQTDLKEKYYLIISEELGPRKAARFTQAEGQLQAMIDFRLASEIPLID